MTQLLRSLKPLAFPFIHSAFPRIQRARPKSKLLRAGFDRTACALIRAGQFFWSDLVGFDSIHMIRLGSFFIIPPISHSPVTTRSALGFILHSAFFLLPSLTPPLAPVERPICLGLGQKKFRL